MKKNQVASTDRQSTTSKQPVPTTVHQAMMFNEVVERVTLETNKNVHNKTVEPNADMALLLATNGAPQTSNWSHANVTYTGDDQVGYERRYWALILLLIPVSTLFGNLMVICSVVRFRYLHSAINYFILGLALADLMVALAVMPFAVYVEFNNGLWELSEFICDLYCAADVTCSTASIFLLTIISFDRYVAATKPIKYLNNRKSVVQVAVINVAVWFLAMLIASPMVLGLNNVPDRDKKKCRFYNADFIIYSSTGSFCIPFVLMIYLYARIYKVVKERGKFNEQRKRKTAIQPQHDKNISPITGDRNGHLDSTLINVNGNTTTCNKTSLTSLSRLNDDRSPNKLFNFFQVDSKKPSLTEINDAATPSSLIFSNNCIETRRSSKSLDVPPKVHSYTDLSHERRGLPRRSSSWVPSISTVLAEAFDRSKVSNSPEFDTNESKSLQSYNSDDSTTVSLNGPDDINAADICTWYADVGGLIFSKIQERQRQMLAEKESAKLRKDSERKATFSSLLNKKKMCRKVLKSAKSEKKATKTLAIVLGVFLICWVPFFTLNLVNAICIKVDVPSCHIGFLPFFLTTWLGYMNSVMNPVIYTVFNLDFRRAFKQNLCPSKKTGQPRRV